MTQPGMAVRYISYGKHTYSAITALANGDGSHDLVLDFPPRCLCHPVSGKTPPRITIVHRVPCDSSGQQAHSWHEKEDK